MAIKPNFLTSMCYHISLTMVLQARVPSHYDIVSLLLSTEKENIKIKALVTPIICPLLSVMMKNLKIPPELKGLKLADRLQSSENLDVDIIIGNDYYGQLITAKNNKN